jgi:hypothetical protein
MEVHEFRHVTFYVQHAEDDSTYLCLIFETKPIRLVLLLSEALNIQ